jgi:transposase
MSAHRPEKVRTWRAYIDDWKRSGQTVNAISRARRLTRSNFDRWQRILAADPVVSPPTPIPTLSPAFVPVRFVGEPMAVVVLHSGVVLRVPLGAAADAVTRLVAAVGRVMLTLLPGGRMLVAVEPVYGRKEIDSLTGVVRSVLKGDPLSGDLFVFKTRTADKLKILAWMVDGFALYLRRLEKGTSAFPAATDASVSVTPTQLAMILGGLDPAKARERRRYKTTP